jgi:phosphonate degradation associated HDIG domain protein
MTADAIIDRLEALFVRRGAEAYLGEAVTVAEHMLQCAALAQAEGAPDALVAAALLHDVGHLTGPGGEYEPGDTHDRRHEQAGADALEGFPPVVVESVRLHVAAKRYLCATDATYQGRLSRASQHSLSLQGGAMDPAEVAAFEQALFGREAVRVRLWDDGGKATGLRSPAFSDFRPLLERVLDAR